MQHPGGREQRPGRTFDHRPMERGVPRQRANAQFLIFATQKIQLGDAVDVEELRRAREAEVHHRRQALAAGEDLALLAVRGEQIEQRLDRRERVILEGGRLHRSTSP